MKRFRLYVDESGDHTYHKLDESDKRYLGLIGCIIEDGYYRETFHPALEKLKQTYFPHSPDDPVILHRRDIMNKNGPFWRLRDVGRKEAFNVDLLTFLEKQEYRIIMVVIDKKIHLERYGKAAFHPYHYCLAVLLERYCGFLKFFGAKGDVMAESRGGKEDMHLKDAYRCIYNDGTGWRLHDFFQDTLTSKEIKLKPKNTNIAGLQLADLLAYPLKREILLDEDRVSDIGRFSGEICQKVVTKYNRQIYKGTIKGYGRIFLL